VGKELVTAFLVYVRVEGQRREQDVASAISEPATMTTGFVATVGGNGEPAGPTFRPSSSVTSSTIVSSLSRLILSLTGHHALQGPSPNF